MRLLRWTFAVYLAAVLVVTCWPSPQSTAAPGWALAVLDAFRSVGLPMSYEFLEAASNVVMFLPFGVLGLLVLCGARPAVPLGRAVGFVVLAGFALSLAIELSQLVIPGRYSTVQDVVMNTTGAVVGAVVVAGILGARRSLTPR
ncbi:VanZ family protein [Oerskovia sp. KBS0722]|uniref:VanZ family protein n=1 Tax=Oerskovia sp. KBS0722 TaxID=1179673 RepID=UPI00110E1903|nr:VanZ family protein [Oerskovia sp. KBS0722]QDW61932.1 VanZ family protein [Oerskovia sp. KBS0722]